MLLGEILIEKHGVKPVDIDKALQFQTKFGGMLGSVLINMGIVDEETVVLALSDQLEVKIFRDKNKTEYLKYRANNCLLGTFFRSASKSPRENQLIL